MKNNYFIQVDFHDAKINKFFFGVITVDLNVTPLNDVAKLCISENFPDIDVETLTIKVAAFNNIR